MSGSDRHSTTRVEMLIILPCFWYTVLPSVLSCGAIGWYPPFKIDVVAIDTLCDVGRSIPRNGDTANCPQGQDEMAEWILGVKSQLDIKEPISLVGYSYGSFVASQVALARPNAVDKLVLMAPAAVVAPFQPSWLLRALVFETFYTIAPIQLKSWLGNLFHGYMTHNPNDLPLDSIVEHWDLTVALNDAGPTKLLGTPHLWKPRT